MSRWPSTKARLVLAALFRIGWRVRREAGTSGGRQMTAEAASVAVIAGFASLLAASCTQTQGKSGFVHDFGRPVAIIGTGDVAHTSVTFMKNGNRRQYQLGHLPPEIQLKVLRCRSHQGPAERDYIDGLRSKLRAASAPTGSKEASPWPALSTDAADP